MRNDPVVNLRFESTDVHEIDDDDALHLVVACLELQADASVFGAAVGDMGVNPGFEVLGVLVGDLQGVDDCAVGGLELGGLHGADDMSERLPVNQNLEVPSIDGIRYGSPGARSVLSGDLRSGVVEAVQTSG